jgi:hypothetical protein
MVRATYMPDGGQLGLSVSVLHCPPVVREQRFTIHLRAAIKVSYWTTSNQKPHCLFWWSQSLKGTVSPDSE